MFEFDRQKIDPDGGRLHRVEGPGKRVTPMLHISSELPPECVVMKVLIQMCGFQ